ncbi:MAG: hypothetical protein IKE18_07815 [Oscillospiraceae bacterium]|nr:hypothetical protein [Oscillospiraceae bacterium]
MLIILNDGTQLEAYSYEASEEYLKIRFINGDREGLKNIFSSEIATKRIQIEGQVFTDHRLDYVTEYTGAIIEIGLVASGSGADEATAAAMLVLAKLQAEALDDETAAEVKALYDVWSGNGVSYTTGKRLQYIGDLYKVLQDHVSQADWTPDTAVSLYVRIDDPTIEWPEWRQPVGAHDAYELGAKVSHSGKHWTSDMANNVYEPGVYGWTEVVGA